MEPPKKWDPARFHRLLEAIDNLNPMSDRLNADRRSAGTILRQLRERAGLKVEEAAGIYAAVYRRLFPGDSEGSASANTIRNWEKGSVNPQHGLRDFLALLTLYILALRDTPWISAEAVENALFLYGYRRLHADEINVLFPRATVNRSRSHRDPTEHGSMRRFVDAARADMRHDQMSDKLPLLRRVASIAAQPQRPALRGDTIDELESVTRRVAGSDADASEFMAYFETLVDTSKDPNDNSFIALLRMFTDRLSGDPDATGSSPPHRDPTRPR